VPYNKEERIFILTDKEYFAMKKKKSTQQTMPTYTGRNPRPKIRFHFRVIFIIFFLCLIAGLILYLVGINFNLISY
jgi:hypothetical protein